MVRKAVDISFTDLLYAVVAGAAFEHFDPYHWSTTGWNNSILLASIVVLLDDWVLYHAQASRTPAEDVNSASILFFDALVLLLWYTMSRSGTIGPDGFYWFLLFLSMFYLLTMLSVVLFLHEEPRGEFIKCDSASALVLAIVMASLYEFKVPAYQWMIPIVLALLIPLRLKAWRVAFRYTSSG
jgi:hypothetical protein